MKRDLKRGTDGEVVCQECGCEGNTKCGHFPPKWALDSGRGCGLDEYLICPCCTDKRAADSASGKMCPVDNEPCDDCAGTHSQCSDVISPNTSLEAR